MERREETPGRHEVTDRLEGLEDRTRALEQEIEYQDKLAFEERAGAAKDARLAAVRSDAELDEAAKESFPASDPAAPASTGGEHDARAEERARHAELDEALDDSFPASDPPSITAPRSGSPEGDAD